jgi:hypothetical protein
MAERVTLAQAADHLRITSLLGSSPMSAEERDLTIKLDAAEAIVLDYLKPNALLNHTPPESLIQAAILLQVAELWRFRGDDPDGDGPPQTGGDLSPQVTNILRRFRDPALA